MMLVEEMELVASGFGISLNHARKRLKEIGMIGYAENFKPHLHWLYFAMASLVIGDAKSILELGTGLAQSTNVLAALFPTARVYTLDLPMSDKGYKHSWEVGKHKPITQVRANVVFVKSNTLFLPSLRLPNKYQLIWVDANHKVPAVAWDIMFAYNALVPGGFLFAHDYEVNPSSRTQVKQVFDYMDGRVKEKIWFLPADSVLNSNNKTACIRKMR